MSFQQITLGSDVTFAAPKQFSLLSDVTFVAPKCIKGETNFGEIIPQGTGTEDAAPPVFWGTFPAGNYRIDYVRGARNEFFAPSNWYLEFGTNPVDGYEIFHSGGQQTNSFPGATTTFFPTGAAVQAANAGLSYSFTHTGGQIGMAIDFPATTEGIMPLPTFRLVGLDCGIPSAVYFVASEFKTLTSDVVFFQPPIGGFVNLSSDVVFVHPQVLNPNAIIPKGLCRDQLCCK